MRTEKTKKRKSYGVRPLPSVKSAVTKKRKVKIPAAIRYQGKKYSVTKIGKKAFAGNRHVRKIILGKNIQSIGKEAFRGCKNLKSISIQACGKIKI